MPRKFSVLLPLLPVKTLEHKLIIVVTLANSSAGCPVLVQLAAATYHTHHNPAHCHNLLHLFPAHNSQILNNILLSLNQLHLTAS